MKTIIALFLLTFASYQFINLKLLDCKTSPIALNENQKEKFDQFYIKFYNDNKFQKSRINFPLKGVLKYWDEENDTLIISERWTKENMTPISGKKLLLKYDKNIQHQIKKSDSLVVEKYWINNSGFSIERKYKIINGKWYLVYYDLFNL